MTEFCFEITDQIETSQGHVINYEGHKVKVSCFEK